VTSEAAPPPIAGLRLDPPPGDLAAFAKVLDRTRIGGIAYRTMRRYSYAKVGLLASGTAYYLFLSLLSLLAFMYGLIAFLGAEQLADALTEFLDQALPGLVGPAGIDPARLRASGATAGIVGLLAMGYGSLGAVGGATDSLHLVYGAPPDPRGFAAGKLRALVTLLMVVPLIVLSFAATTLATGLVEPVLEAAGLDPGDTGTRMLIRGGGLLLGLAVNVLVLWVLLGRIGGIRPHRAPRLVASLGGAVAALVIQQLLGLIIGWSLAKPQYGALAIPLALLFVLSLLSTVLYGSAALVGGISDARVPLTELGAASRAHPSEPD
jgi:uncharacterized BrkB/YihY/UPF0761 family membrane protein